MAIIVGGTNYYIESLIWETLVTSYSSSAENMNRLTAEAPKSCYPDESTTSLYIRLQNIDPERARTVCISGAIMRSTTNIFIIRIIIVIIKLPTLYLPRI